MTEILSVAILILLAVNLGALIFLLRRKPKTDDPQLEARFGTMEKLFEQSSSVIHDELAKNRQEAGSTAREGREETIKAQVSLGESLRKELSAMGSGQKGQLDSFAKQLGTLSQSNEQKLDLLTKSNEERLNSMREVVDKRLRDLQQSNTEHLERMRETVDEKLQGTLEKRLGESFKQVSERLEQVHQGFGEMQALASGVGDLKKVLSNVSTRGAWGEVQLEALLEQILSPDQYGKNVKPNENTGAVVEFAIKLPGKYEHRDEIVWLPIDAKFPMEDYRRLQDAQENADLEGVEQSSKALSDRIKSSAKDISQKYLFPPKTTDFGVMFLPTEGLYAEVARQPELLDYLQREHRVVVAGPATFAALLNSLQMGFRTLAIQERSSEVWKLLSAVKTEFGKFGAVLDGVRKKLEQATTTMDKAAVRSRAIERKLREVEELPVADADVMLMATNGDPKEDL